MAKIGIAIDTWKLSIFERHLRQADYYFEQFPGVTPDTLLLTVVTENAVGLYGVVQNANREAAQTKASQ